MKKVLVFLLSLVVMSNCIFAQGEKEQTKENGPVEITFWSLFTGGDGEFFDAMVDEFNKSQNEVIMKNDTVKFDNYYTKLTTALAANNAPDLVIVHRGNMLNYVNNNQFVALNDYFDNDTLSDFVKAPLKACTFDGKIYSIPLDVHPLVMYYNKDILNQAGVTSIPTNGEQLMTAMKMVKEKTGNWGLLIDEPYELPRTFISLIGQQGGSILNSDNTKANINNEKGIKALSYLQDLVNKDKLTPSEVDYDSAMNLFKLGEAAFYINGVWATGTLEQEKDLNLGVMPLPSIFSQNAAWSDSHTFAIPNQKNIGEDKIEAAVKFIKWATAHGEMWAKAGHIPTRESVYKKSEFKALPFRADYSAASSFAMDTPRTPAWSQIYNAINENIQIAVRQNLDPQVTLVKLESEINNIISTY
ncbi:MAG: ABC transporter substrate-binding protein [Spirochaetia bacterium]|nr:ABC transporter substrate-binding protein [Spirochaetia bacterium]